ncbi:MAG TPA: hypothetical protein RMH99_25025 [Sandaracinaceae bacterium LLY-WYZ-13_1]|nr:hypothetical protein [Sandaracinaceae bacterium LLY-WYZ-13_1]
MRWRRAFAAATLLALLVWPPVQHVLHREMRVSSWKLFGLGVYSRPKLTLRFELTADGTPVDLRTLSPASHEALVDLRDRTRDLGLLVDPAPAACTLARARDAATVTVTRIEHDLGADGHIRRHVHRWTVNRRACSP